MSLNSLSSLKHLKGRRVLVRADFNVPVKNGRVTDNYKLTASLPTIRRLLKFGARIILVSHLGRPEKFDTKFSLKPVSVALEKLLGQKIYFLPVKKTDHYFNSASQAVARLKPGEILMLDNCRFWPGEEKNNPALARQLAALADIFVLDGFAVAHRDAASVSGVAKYLPAYAGLLMEKEVTGLSRATEKPQKPLVVILGGIKMETKIPVLKNLLAKADYVLVGGGISNTYLWAKGWPVGASAIDKKHKKDILKYAANKKIIWPVDVIIGDAKGRGARAVPVETDFAVIGKTDSIFDIGPQTIKLFAKFIKTARTIVWNGALGYFEQKPYQYGTYAVARLIAARSQGPAFSICGGGETVEVLTDLGLASDIDLVSTGGGAMLEFLSGKILPGVKAVTSQ